MCVGEQAPKSSKYDFSKIYIQNYKNQKFLGRVRWVRWVRWVRQLVEAIYDYLFFCSQLLLFLYIPIILKSEKTGLAMWWYPRNHTLFPCRACI